MSSSKRIRIKCMFCQQDMSNIYDRLEEWGPYKAIWSRFGGRPWTHIMRDHPAYFFAALIPTLILLFFYTGKKHWLKLVWACLLFFLGLLTGHVWW